MLRIKRIMAAFLVALTLLSCNVTGFAAKNPQMSKTAYASSWKVKRGSSIKVRFVVNSNSYTFKNGRYRTLLRSELYYNRSGSLYPCSNNMRQVGVTGNKVNVYVTYKMSSSTATGTYTILAAVFKHSSGAKKPATAPISKWTRTTSIRGWNFKVY